MRELEVKIDKNLEGKTLEKILRENLGLTKKEISRAKFQPQGIRVNGEKQRITYRPLAGQVLRVCTEEQNKEKSRVMACEGGFRFCMRTGICWFWKSREERPVTPDGDILKILWETGQPRI